MQNVYEPNVKLQHIAVGSYDKSQSSLYVTTLTEANVHFRVLFVIYNRATNDPHRLLFDEMRKSSSDRENV